MFLIKIIYIYIYIYLFIYFIRINKSAHKLHSKFLTHLKVRWVEFK
ncbi:MAG: hypothetical protein N7Q72_05345 [Spiroplasma sp. Tabriz.8]|nr:hypothetical protein [Spiroplasma sp. Tabriz.8]